MAGIVVPRPAAPVRFALAGVLAACGVASAFVVGELREAGGAPTAYAALSAGAVVADLGAGLGLLLAGGVASLAPPRSSVGPLVGLAGVAWLAADWIGWDGGPTLARSAAMVMAPFLLAFVAHLAAAFPGGHAGRPGLAVVVVAYGATTFASVGQAVIRDPFLDRHCWSNCTVNDFLVDAKPQTVGLLTDTWLWSTVVIGLALATLCAWRLVQATHVARPTLAPVLGPAALVGATEALHAALLLHDPAEDPERALFAAVYVARAVALAAVAVGVAWSVVRARHARRAVARLAEDLGEVPAPGALRSVLARSLGDDQLDVAYWIPSAGRYVDAAGRPVSPEPGPEQAATAIVRGASQETIALVMHDRSLHSQHNLEREIGATARLAVDNERLRAEALVQLEQLRASRSRIVATADATRRQLERDLHDGAQQTLLAVRYELRLAHGAAVSAGDTHLATALSRASAEAKRALDELRELAHGIFPAILTEAGLGPALWTLADQAPIPLEIDEVVEARYPAAAETAAYLVVHGAVEDAAHRAATHVVARVGTEGGHLVVEAHDDGRAPPTERLVHLADRVGALGGRMDMDGPRVRAEIPCA